MWEIKYRIGTRILAVDEFDFSTEGLTLQVWRVPGVDSDEGEEEAFQSVQRSREWKRTDTHHFVSSRFTYE
jgi:hypothetical protein